MKIEPTSLKDVYTICPKYHEDHRGYFAETYNLNSFIHCKELPAYHWVQDNQSFSYRGTLRGLHFQEGAWAQAKLVRVIAGTVLDVVVDLRVTSPTYKKSLAIELSDKNQMQLLVPRGFAHGFITLSESALFFYKCDNFYSKENEAGIRFDDPDLNIDWPIPLEQLKISDKDRELPFLSRYLKNHQS
jgi:dTDP-4-dehydrorhamnose 3,5-epimerase